MNRNYSLYLVTDSEICPEGRFLETVEAAIQGGVTMVQLREKKLSSRAFYQEALALKKLTDAYHIPLIINDRLDIMLAADAAGLHIGQSDLPAEVVRQIMGRDKILGLSARTVEQAEAARKAGADYLGVGAVFPTSTKKDALPLDKEMLRKIKTAAGLPVVGIGGIKAENISEIYGSGIDGVAVVSAIMGHSSPKIAAEELRNKVEHL